MKELGELFSKFEMYLKLHSFNTRLIAFVLLAIVFFCASFGIFHATLSNNTILIGVMMLLLAVFSDLKTFNFWGLTGEKIEDDLKKLQGKSGVNQKALPKPKANDVIKAETVTLKDPVQLKESLKGNFLTLVYDLERLMRLAATVIKGKEEVPGSVQDVLKDTGLLKDTGVQQLELIQRIRNIIVQGKDSIVDDSVVSSAMKIAATLHAELNSWLLNSKK